MVSINILMKTRALYSKRVMLDPLPLKVALTDVGTTFDQLMNQRFDGYLISFRDEEDGLY